MPALPYGPHGAGKGASLLDLFALTGIPQMVSDAKWSVTHPLDRIQGKGRAANGQMVIPWGPEGSAGLSIAKLTAKSPRLKLATSLANKSTADQLVSHSAGDTLDSVYGMLDSAPAYTGQPLRRGRLYKLLPDRVRYNQRPPEPDVRLAVIQDPKSGALFAARGDYHHGELMGAVERISAGMKEPLVHYDPTARVPPSPFEGTQWMQHEIWAKQKLHYRDGSSKDLPGKVNFSSDLHSRPATFGRMRLLRDLKKSGFSTMKENPEGTSAFARMMREKYGLH